MKIIRKFIRNSRKRQTFLRMCFIDWAIRGVWSSDRPDSFPKIDVFLPYFVLLLYRRRPYLKATGTLRWLDKLALRLLIRLIIRLRVTLNHYIPINRDILTIEIYGWNSVYIFAKKIILEVNFTKKGELTLDLLVVCWSLHIMTFWIVGFCCLLG